MIAHLRGTLVSKTPAELIIDVHGVGFHVSIPLSTYEALGAVNEPVTILTHFHVREDAMQLFGFATEAERELFRSLLSISGIGPKMAQGILSGLRPAQLKQAIVAGDLQALTAIPGVGRKTAERVVLELRHSLGALDLEEPAVVPTSAQLKIQSEAMVALMALGYTRPSAEQALRAAGAARGGKNLSVEELITLVLQKAAKQ
jgi:Holliday junction DNA helicase RuvA